MYSIFKTFVLSLLMIAQVHFAYAQNAAILPPAKTTFVDQNGKPLTSGTVDFYIPGTTTHKTTWQDQAATIANTNPVVLDAAGRALILGNGAYREVVKDRVGNIIWDQVTNSAGAGGSGQSTVGDGNQPGTIIPFAGFVAPTNYAFPYGQEYSRTTYVALLNNITISQNVTCASGNATLTTVADTTQLNIGAAVEAACVSAGSTIISKTANTVTISSLATVSTTTVATFFPWGNGNGITTFNAPDLRGVVLPGRNNMGGASSSNLSSPYYTDPNALAGVGGSLNNTLKISNLPNGTISTNAAQAISVSSTFGDFVRGSTVSSLTGGGAVPNGVQSATFNTVLSTGNNSISVTASNNGGIGVSATVAAGGSGYTAGTQLLTVLGGTCTTQPQFNITTSAGAITAPVLVTAGQCSIAPVNPASTSGGGGTLGTLNVTYSAIPLSTIQPSKTINYIVKILPDVIVSAANCENLNNAGTACAANTGSSGHTLPFLNVANTWSAAQTFNSVAISGGTITGMPSPSASSDVATKAYVDSVATGLNILAPTTLATAAVLPNTPTYANGALGVGATLTAGSNTTLTVDGTAAPLSTVVLVKNQASAFQNGVYTVTTAGNGAAAWVLTRATYFDQAAEMKAGSYTVITSGATNSGSAYVLQSAVTTVGTDALNWVLFSSVAASVTSIQGQSGAFTCAATMTCSGNQLAVTNYTAPWTNAVAYPQSTVNKNIIYMTDFMGATTCDGVTDQTTNMQRFLTAVSVAGTTTSAGNVYGVFAQGNCLTNATPVLTVNSNTNLPVNYYLRGYGTTITPNPANVISGLQVLRGTNLSRGDESRTTTIEGLTINVRNNSNAVWGIYADESRVTALRTNCFAGDDGVTHNQGNFACYYWYQTDPTNPNTGAFYGRLLHNTAKGTGISTSRMPNAVRIDGSGGNAMIIEGNSFAQGNYGIRLFNPCATINANCAYIANGINIINNTIENFAGDCINITTTVPTISQITGIIMSQNRMETCTNSAINISSITQQSTIWPSYLLANICIGCGAYITNANAIQVVLSPAKQWP